MSQADYNKGKELYSAKEYQNAIDAFVACLLNKCNEKRALIYIIDCYAELANYAKAKEFIDKLLQIEPSNTMVLFYLGKYWLSLKEYDKAYANINSYIDRNRLQNDQSIKAYEALYEIKMLQGIYNVALDHIQYAHFFEERTAPKNLVRKVKEFKALNKLEKHEDIVFQFSNLTIPKEEEGVKEELMLQKAIALCAYDIDKENNCKFDECFQICKEYLSRNQKFHFPLAKCYYKQGKYTEALITADQYIKIEPNESEGHVLRGIILNQLKKKNSAYKAFQEATKLDPKCYGAYIEMVKMLLSIQKYQEAYQEIKDVNPTQEETQVALQLLLKKAEIYYNLHKPEEANLLMDQIGELLRDNNIENKVNPQRLEEALESYFTLFHLKGGYVLEDFDKGTEVLGKGGFGLVTKGRLKNKDVAVKEYIINEERKKEKKKINFLINCINEMKSMEELMSNPNILRLETMFYIEEKIYILTEYCEGGNLSTLIHETSIEFPFQRRIEILIQVAQGIKYLHSFKKPFIHYDIKPLNILLVKKYDKKAENKIKICDFGLTKTSFVFNPLGTPSYIAPELLLNKFHSSKVDVYSFGITMWEVFARASPYCGVNYKEITNRVIGGQRPDQSLYDKTATNEIKKLIAECIEQEEHTRPSMEQIANALGKMI